MSKYPRDNVRECQGSSSISLYLGFRSAFLRSSLGLRALFVTPWPRSDIGHRGILPWSQRAPRYSSRTAVDESRRQIPRSNPDQMPRSSIRVYFRYCIVVWPCMCDVLRLFILGLPLHRYDTYVHTPHSIYLGLPLHSRILWAQKPDTCPRRCPIWHPSTPSASVSARRQLGIGVLRCCPHREWINAKVNSRRKRMGNRKVKHDFLF